MHHVHSKQKVKIQQKYNLNIFLNIRLSSIFFTFGTTRQLFNQNKIWFKVLYMPRFSDGFKF